MNTLLTFASQFSLFRDSFKLAQRAFRGERVIFVKINLVQN